MSRLDSTPLQMIGRRLVVAAGAGAGNIGGLYLSEFLALAAIDGGSELPAWVFYSVPILGAAFLSTLPMSLGLFPKRHWRGAAVGVGGSVGAALALLSLTSMGASAASLFRIALLLGAPAVAAFAGSFAWMDGAVGAAARPGSVR